LQQQITYFSLVSAEKGLLIHSLSLSAVVEIGFEQTSYAVDERNKSVTVCASVISGTPTVPLSVTLVTVDISSALGKHN